jgi:REase_MTES_1575
VVDRLHALRGDGATLGRLPDLHRLRGALDTAGLTELVDDLATWNPDVEGALDTFEFCLMASIVDDIRLSDRRVGGFDGHQHTNTVEDFQHADRRHIATTAQRVRRLAAERAYRVGDEQPDQATLVKLEAAKKSRHLPVRETFNAAPEVMTSIKPCWVMSPLVVSQVLPNDRPCFDVVIFDEASQVRPAAAKQPDQPGRLVLAIEADGASYHSGETARDRDRLRQEQLERLGWRFHRIWSQDWFTNRKREIDKAVAAYHAAVEASDNPAAASAQTVRLAAPPDAPRGKERGPRPNLFAWGQIDEFTDRDLQATVRWIESDTILRSREDLIQEVMAALGFERRGKKIVRRIGTAIDAVRAQTRP